MRKAAFKFLKVANYKITEGAANMIQMLKVDSQVLKQYRQNVSFNEHMSDEDIVKKLTRNVLLAHTAPVEGSKYSDVNYHYGRLVIKVRNGTEIISIENYQQKLKGWKLDKYKQRELNELLGITPSINLNFDKRMKLEYNKIKTNFIRNPKPRVKYDYKGRVI